MKFPSPKADRLKREDLLKQVREELRRRYPSFAAVMDLPGDPGWMLLEQAAWMTELMSEALARQPREVVEYLLGLLGRELRPAVPAIGVVALRADGCGTLDAAESPPRIYAGTTAGREKVDFALVERDIPLVSARLTGWYRIERGRLLGNRISSVDFPDDTVAMVGVERDLALLDREQIVYRLNRRLDGVLEGLLQRLKAAFATDGPAAVGWLSLDYSARGGIVEITVDIDASAPFPDEGEDRRPAVWGRIADWRPEPEADPNRRGLRVSLDTDGRPMLTGAPLEEPAAALLRPREVAPANFPETLWEHLRALLGGDGGQLPNSSSYERKSVAPVTVPKWLSQLPFSRHWARIQRSSGRVIAVRTEGMTADSQLRLGVIVAGAGADFEPPTLEILGEDGSPIVVRAEWSASLPRPAILGRGIAFTVVYRVERAQVRRNGELVARVIPHPGGRSGVVLGAMLNPALILNAPSEHDGRSVTVTSGTGEIDLLWPNLIDRTVLRRLSEGLPEGSSRPLRRILDEFPVARLEASRHGEEDRVLEDWQSMRLDTAVGRAQYGVPNDEGHQTLEPGTTLRLVRYRRTSGARSNLAEGEISEVEQEPDARPRITGVINPLPTHLGEDVEKPDAAVYRMFGPERGEIPTVPSDLERLVRQSLGPKEQTWEVRVRTHAERVLLRAVFQGAEMGPVWARGLVHRARRRLDLLGPHGLLVVIGDPEAPPDEARFTALATAIRRRLLTIADRVPHFRDAVVLPLLPLLLRSEADVDGLDLPRDNPRGLPEGTIASLDDLDSPVPIDPGVDLWLDAAIVRAERTRFVHPPAELEADAPGFSEMLIRDW